MFCLIFRDFCVFNGLYISNMGERINNKIEIPLITLYKVLSSKCLLCTKLVSLETHRQFARYHALSLHHSQDESLNLVSRLLKELGDLQRIIFSNGDWHKIVKWKTYFAHFLFFYIYCKYSSSLLWLMGVDNAGWRGLFCHLWHCHTWQGCDTWHSLTR